MHTVSYGILISSKEGQYRDPIDRKRTRYFFSNLCGIVGGRESAKEKGFSSLTPHDTWGLGDSVKENTILTFFGGKELFLFKKVLK